jgi:predicted enzyme related to lactoylglutathione lyase
VALSRKLIYYSSASGTSPPCNSRFFSLLSFGRRSVAALFDLREYGKRNARPRHKQNRGGYAMTTPENPKARPADMKLEIIVIPVSDVDRAKEFYASLGWRLDADFAANDFRVIQFTPPGSGCSVIFGKNVTAASPGSAQGLYLIVSDIEATRKDLAGRGIKVSEAFHHSGDVYTGPDEPFLFGRRRVGGLDPERGTYRSFASFSDPDGNGWLFQEITARLPGRVDANDTAFTSPIELAAALRRAEAAHGVHEQQLGHRDEDWPSWYAEYMVQEQSSKSEAS